MESITAAREGEKKKRKKKRKSGNIGDGLSPLDPLFWLQSLMVESRWPRGQNGHATPDPMTDIQAISSKFEKKKEEKEENIPTT